MNKSIGLDSKVWGPHYWFFLHTIALSYPIRPNTITKKKYYDFVQNIPIFIPIESMSTEFSKLLDNYPISPYLDSRDSFTRWMHFIHNKINEKLEIPKITLEQFYTNYYEEYKPKHLKMRDYYKTKGKIIYIGSIVIIIGIIYYLYNK
jgi:hypothetical protein